MMAGYHLKEISKGILGKVSKIREELEELEDAEQQGARIMMLLEAADLYGALEAFARDHDFTMDDLKKMSDITKRAFVTGGRK